MCIVASPEVIKMLTPGKKVRVFYGENNPNNQIRHIRAIVDEQYVTYRVWNRKRQRWIYHTIWIYDFQLAFEGNHLTGIK